LVIQKKLFTFDKKNTMTHIEGLKANKIFFQNILLTLNENGVWLWPATMSIFKKKNNKLLTDNKDAYNKVLKITPKEIHNIFSYSKQPNN
jgi:hypothetical protein